jgi:hypothetical protein
MVSIKAAAAERAGSVQPISIPLVQFRRALSPLCIYGVAVTLLCLPAIWNGFPLVFDDLGGYLERWPTRSVGNGRSVPYGLLLWITRTTWWVPTVMLQSVVTVWIVDRALVVFGQRRSPWTTAAVVAAISATSGMAFFVSKVMPDAWAAPAVLALHLLAWHSERLTRLERLLLAAIIAFAGASHMATLALLTGLSVLHAVAWLFAGRARTGAAGILFAAAAAWLGLVVLLVANLVVAGRIMLTPGGDVFLFARLTESGIIGKVLAEECPRADWHLCDYQKDLPSTADALLWDDDSPLYLIGGWDDPRAKREIASIMARSLRTQPLEHLENAVALSARQLVTFGMSDSMARFYSFHAPWSVEKYAPWLTLPYGTARQQSGEIDLALWSAWIVWPISLAGLCALPLVALFAWRRGAYREAMLPGMLFLALLVNASICGVASGPHGRYQARLAWLAPFGSVLVLAALRQHRERRQSEQQA